MIEAREKPEAGFALVATLVVLAFLSILALMLAQKFRTGARISAMKTESVEFKAVSEAALTHTIIALTDPDSNKAWQPDGVAHIIELQGRKVSISIQDELGKLDVNTGDPELLKRFFSYLQEDQSEVDQAVAAMEDWRDQDNTKRPFGAEAADYRRAGRNHLPSNTSFETLGELAWVIGMSDELYACVSPALTVHSHRRSPDESRAHPLLVRALDLEVETGGPARAVSAIKGGLGGRAFEVEISIAGAGARRWVTRTILRITENRNEPYWVLDRQEGTADRGADACPGDGSPSEY